jgi:hypothetical protein
LEGSIGNYPSFLIIVQMVESTIKNIKFSIKKISSGNDNSKPTIIETQAQQIKKPTTHSCQVMQ